MGICSGKGVRKLRHLDTHAFWVQQAFLSKRFGLQKVPGEESPADLLTKHTESRERLLKLMAFYDSHFKERLAE